MSKKTKGKLVSFTVSVVLMQQAATDFRKGYDWIASIFATFALVVICETDNRTE